MFNKEQKARLFRWGSSNLPNKLPDCLFWPIWKIWLEITQSDELRHARIKFYRAVDKKVEIKFLSNKYPSDDSLRIALKHAEEEAAETYRELKLVKE